jgi:hypothetical protein
MHNLYLLESDHENVGGLLIKYGDGYAQTLTWRDKPGSAPHEVGKELAAQALAHLLQGGRGSLASDVNWTSMAAACGEQFRVWRSRQGGRGTGEGLLG